mgnify:FL=1
MEQIDVVVTVRCADTANPLPGATLSRCHACEEAVWIAPTTLAILKGGETIICHPCARPLIVEDPTFRMPTPTDDQRLEIARATGLYGDALDAAIESVRRKIDGGEQIRQREG